MMKIVRRCPECNFTELSTVLENEIPSNVCRKCWKKHGKLIPTRNHPATQEDIEQMETQESCSR